MLTKPSDEEPTGGTQIWKHISNQQMTERQKAVGENARLRQLVREQVRSVKSMQRTLEKTPDLSKMGIATDSDVQERAPAPKEIYRDLFKNITSSYQSGAGKMLLQQPCMPSPSLVAKRKMNMEVETVGECGPRMCLQFVESRRIPFSLLRIGDHAWDFLSGSSGHENFQMALQNQGNELFGHCTVNNPSGSIQTLGNIAVRRYYEANKLTFAWECDGLCAQEDDSTIRVHQKGCEILTRAFYKMPGNPQNDTIFRACVLKKMIRPYVCIKKDGNEILTRAFYNNARCVFEPAEGNPQNDTIFRACVRMTPSLVDVCDSLADSAKAVGQTTEMVIENYEKTVVYIFDAVVDSLACEANNKARKVV
ncbi:hypothetical protein PHMEG_00025116 [Phytophthora megakarya]|uniref:M96 mating-specific protein n=1 Tax=Phytophthora megakarya TaxID=4795 RepID=A0A225VCY7_9STRA|nr:hypothetical protein PHMEG_00025116 [Phytophthora megakarya]